jgi:N-acyl-D-aspartate/D-glutamate deacylase
MLDIAIEGGTVIDGTGAARSRADVGIRNGRIVSVGTLDEPARRTIDARDRIVAPGFIDIHVHYDAQLSWDPLATPSVFHGITTVIGGNCGFSIAPLAPGQAEYIMHMLARVEGMPLAALEGATDWSWSSYGEWLERFEGRLGVNAGFMVGHSAIRRAVMGESSGEAATPDQIADMVRMAHEALNAGAVGFSSSQSATHNDGDGQPVPSRAASEEELLTLAAAVAEHPGTSLEYIPAGLARGFDEADLRLMAGMSVAAQRPLNWNLLTVDSAQPEAHEKLLSISSRAEELGARVIALTLPDVMRVRLTFQTGFGFDVLPDWADAMALAPDERLAALRSPSVRDRLRAGAASAPPLFVSKDFAAMVVAETFAPENAGHQGRLIGDIARQRGADALDTLLDIVVADELATGLVPRTAGTDDESWRLRAKVWTDPRTVIGASDAGAHLDMICNAGYTTSLLGNGVRDRELLSLEEAVRELTDVPARLYGLRDRGRIEAGYFADVALFDADTVAPSPEYTRHDMPNGATRLYTDAIGVSHVFVNGVPVVVDGKESGELPGSLLRGGQDTETTRR